MTDSRTPKYIRCPQGHVFDRSLHATCPTCHTPLPDPPSALERPIERTIERPAERTPPREVGVERLVPARRPGGELYARPLHFVWIVDCSGSMLGEKMASVNYAIRSVVPEMQEAADDNTNVQVLVRVLGFSNGARWHVDEPVPLSQFAWADVSAEPQAVTDLGQALRLLAQAVASPPMPARALPPVLVLLTDGQATDDFQAGLQALLDQDGGRKAVRVSIAIGADADLPALEKFNSFGLKPLRAHNATDLVKFIKWVSTVLVTKPQEGGGHLTGMPDPDGGPLLW